MGKPKLIWLEDVEKDLRGMKVKRWRKKEAGRAEWAY
jgi:hypothetical protein